MNDRVFIDTNIWVYAFASVKGSFASWRTSRAQEIVNRGGAISVQVLNEFVQVCRRKALLDWDHIDGALRVVETLSESPVSITLEIHESALGIARRFGLNIYDALIIAAAESAGCATLYTEDMQHGQTVGSVTIVNPFR